MRILLAYIAVTNGRLTLDFASRFIGTYSLSPPGIEHSTVVVCNGGPLPFHIGILFDSLKPKFFCRPNDGGWDISGFQDVANQFPCDMLVCLGESIYFHRPGWLRRMADAWEKHGPGMYGFFSSNLVRPHLNTTGFVVEPTLLPLYPRPHNQRERYDFEHGSHSFWRVVQGMGKPTKLVTWDGEWGPLNWREPNNILWKGNQTNLMAFCTHTDRFNAASNTVKAQWTRWADAPSR